MLLWLRDIAGFLVLTLGLFIFWLFGWQNWVAEIDADADLAEYYNTVATQNNPPGDSGVVHVGDVMVLGLNHDGVNSNETSTVAPNATTANANAALAATVPDKTVKNSGSGVRVDGKSVRVGIGKNKIIGMLYVDKWQNKYGMKPMPIRKGTTASVLRAKVAGWYPGTQWFGEPGNTGLAGHRRGRGNSFEHIDSLKQGDTAHIETLDGTYNYKVVLTRIVRPGDGWVLGGTPEGLQRFVDDDPYASFLTLTSCHSLTLGKWGNDRRYVVHLLFTGKN